MSNGSQALVLHIGCGMITHAVLVSIICQCLQLQVAYSAISGLWFHTSHTFVFAFFGCGVGICNAFVCEQAVGTSLVHAPVLHSISTLLMLVGLFTYATCN